MRDTPRKDVNWRRERKVGLPSLPHERKALAERYTIDADEAERRVRLAAGQAAVEQSEKLAAEALASAQTAPDVISESAEQSADLPIYRWFGTS